MTTIRFVFGYWFVFYKDRPCVKTTSLAYALQMRGALA